MAKKWANADEIDQQIKDDVGRAPCPASKIAAQMTDAMISVVMTTAMIGATITTTAAMTIVIGVGRTTLGGGRATTD
jgi:hypothetical protein